MKRLIDLTNCISGIILYLETKNIIRYSWHNEEGLPIISTKGIIMWPVEFEPLGGAKEIKDCQAELNAHIPEGDFNDLKGQHAKKYLIKHDKGFAIILCPETWK